MYQKQYYVYILASKKNGTLYTGVTGNLIKRVWQHKNKIADGFTKKYGVDKLVYYETTNDIISAIEREKRIKKWKRQWKIELIAKSNPEWRDLYKDFFKDMDSRFRGNDKEERGNDKEKRES
jgi:putative endonuclease